MTYKNEQCPRCGNVVRGELAPNGGRDFANWAGKKVAKQGVMDVSAEIAACDPLAGMATAVLGTIFAGKAVDAATSNIGEGFVFECPGCGHRWLSNGRPPMPPQIIMQVREEYLYKLSTEKPIAAARVFGTLAIVFSFIFFICCIMAGNDDVGFWEVSQWAVLGILFFPLATVFGIIAIVKGKRAASKTREEQACETQDLFEFKETHPQLFSKYNQYS